MTIEDFGFRVATVWQGLRPTTRSLIERALLQRAASNNNAHVLNNPKTPATVQPNVVQPGNVQARVHVSADARAEWELSRLLAALDERAIKQDEPLDQARRLELRRVSDACAQVLQHQAQSAEAFAQLLERALLARDYKQVDALADTISSRLNPGEMCELARHPQAAVRAIAHEALAQVSTETLFQLFNDPVDHEVAHTALIIQADEYNSEQARMILYAIEDSEVMDE